MFSTSMLATGGLTAALIAGWHQVKSFASYLTSFVIVRAKLDATLKLPVHMYLRTSYRLLPSGIHVFAARYMHMRGKKSTIIVPFRITSNTVVYIKGWHFVLMTLESEGMTLMSIRGLVNFQTIITAALNQFEARMEKLYVSEALSRFQVMRVIGTEKSMAGAGNIEHPRGGNSIAEATSRSDGSSHYQLDTSIDKPFMYRTEDFLDNAKTDPFDGLYFDESVERYIRQAQQWMTMGDWYIERGIPWRRGWLLYGPGGTGKSSLAKAVAQKLAIPIYHYYLATLSDQEFIREWNGMSTPCVALCEDFDAIFRLRESLTEHKMLTFDCVLNQISGVGSTSGVFLMVTTNHLEHIDPAMGVECGKDGVSTRPGRIDSVIHIGKMSKENRYKLANKILRDWPEAIEIMVQKSDDVTPIQFQEMCIQYAFDRLSETEVEAPLRLVGNA